MLCFGETFVLSIEMEIKEFKIKVLSLRGKFYGLARKIVEDSDNAEDVTQEVMMKLWEMRHELDKCHNIEAFAITMIRNAAIDMLRTEKTNLPLLEESIGHQTLSDDHLHDVKSEVELIKRIIEMLPEIQRNTIRMKDVEGFENEEIAEITGCNILAVRSNLSRARKKVRDVYFQIIKERNKK